MNWIDWGIISILIVYGVQGWFAGLIQVAATFLSFLGSLWFASLFQGPVSIFLTQKFGLIATWSRLGAYILIVFISQTALSLLFSLLMSFVPSKVISSLINKILGMTVSLINGTVIIAFVLMIILQLPLRGTIRTDIRGSKIGAFLVGFAERFGGPITSMVNEATVEARRFMTVKPDSNDRLELDEIPPGTTLVVSESDETAMFQLVNRERSKVGVPPLGRSDSLTDVARLHGRDMLARQYFSHVSPQGKDAADRLVEAGVPYVVVGENLAYAPDVDIAHTGLMESPGHRHNILDPQFKKIGIGVIDAGIFGKTFVQEFTN